MLNVQQAGSNNKNAHLRNGIYVRKYHSTYLKICLGALC